MKQYGQRDGWQAVGNSARQRRDTLTRSDVEIDEWASPLLVSEPNGTAECLSPVFFTVACRMYFTSFAHRGP